MKAGNWVPISKAFVSELPKDRAFTRLEAAFCIQCDHNEGRPVTITGYSNLWRWSKGKVRRFLAEMKAAIVYPHDTTKMRNQSGLIVIHKPDLNRPKNGLIRAIDFKWLHDDADPKGTKTGLKTDLKQDTTTYNNLNLEENTSPKGESSVPTIPFYLTKRKRKLHGKRLEDFERFWAAFNYKTGKAAAADSWVDLQNYSPELVECILRAAGHEAARRPRLIEKGLTPKMAQGWLTDRRWEDEKPAEKKPDHASPPTPLNREAKEAFLAN